MLMGEPMKSTQFRVYGYLIGLLIHQRANADIRMMAVIKIMSNFELLSVVTQNAANCKVPSKNRYLFNVYIFMLMMFLLLLYVNE